MRFSRMAIYAITISCFVAQAKANAAILRVCQAGCTYSTVQAALDAVQDGDVIEIEAGQVFSESLRLPIRRGVTVRSSRWSELPPLGTRIDPEKHAHLLPTVRNPNRFSTALSAGQDENVFLQGGVDESANTIRFETAFGLTENTPVACFGTKMPVPLVEREKYFLRNWNPATRTGQLALAPNGETIDLLDQGSSGSPGYYTRPRCTAWFDIEDWTFRGIRFEALANPGGEMGWLVNVGSNQQPAREMGPNRIRFHQVVVTGQADGINGPSFCLVLAAGSGHEVISSWIGHCKATGGIESKAIWLQNVHNVEIRNNYVSGASINILTAGGDSARGEVVADVRIRGNLIEKAGNMMYREGVGAPSGDCYYGGGSGAFYRRTDVTPNTCANGACYTCQENSSWALDTNTFYRPGNFLTKNLIELKDCDECLIEGNVFRGSYIGPDAGQGACISITAATGSGFGSGYHRNYNVTVRNNWCDQTYSGLTAGNGVIDGPGFDQLPMRNIVFENNLVTNLGRFPALSQWPSPNDVFVRNFGTGQGIDGLRFVNNTFRPAPGSTARNGVLFGPGAWPPANVVNGLDLRNNIFQFNGAAGQCAMCIAFPPADEGSCRPGGFLRFVPDTTEKLIRHNLFSGGAFNPNLDFVKDNLCSSKMFAANEFIGSVEEVGFVGNSDSRLASTSPFSAANANAVLLDSEGKDLGADIDVLEMYTRPAESGLATMPEQLKVGVDVGTTQAVLRYSRPGEAACSVSLYTQAARIPQNLHPDTNTAELQQDSREGNVVEAAEVQFLLGRQSALLAGQRYQYRIHCGTAWAIGWFQTLSSPDSAGEPDRVVEAAVDGEQGVVEFSANANFSAPQSSTPVAAASGKLVLPLPSVSQARYVRYRILNGQGQARKESGIRIRPAR